MNQSAESSRPDGATASASFGRLLAAEKTRHRRLRVAGAAALLLNIPLFLYAPGNSPFGESDPSRFGYFGPTRLLPEIDIRQEIQEGNQKHTRNMEFRAVTVKQEAGGAETRALDLEGPDRSDETGRQLQLEGAFESELRRIALPVVQSEDLVIEHLVKPVYPVEARLRGLEAIVELEALVDEKGRVRSIRKISNSGDPMFEEVSRRAVRSCRFRPYLENGKPKSIYARFRFAFDLI